MFTFRLMLEDGTPADPPTFVSSEPNWRVGDTVILGPERRMRVVRLYESDASETVLVVETG